MEANEREQAALNQVPDVRSVQYNTPMHNFQSAITTLTSPEDELYMMELELRSMSVDGEGNIKQMGDPLLNDTGIRSVLLQVRATMSRVAIMSNLNDKMVSELTLYMAESLAKDLMMNNTVYEIKNVSARTKIFRMVNTNVYIALKRAQDEGERKFWKGSQQEITTRIDGGGKQGKGLWGAIGNMFK